MKKTLIALAALAATGATFAQVTITGTIASGYQQSNLNTGWAGLESNAARATIVAAGGLLGPDPGARTVTQQATSGFGVDRAEIFFTAKEDLGGGQSVEAKMGLENVFRGATATTSTTGFGQHDVSLSYTNTSFGRVSLSNERGAAILSGVATAGAPVIAMDDKLFERRSAGEKLTFVTKLGSVVTGYQYSEATQGLGLGAGTSGAATTLRQRSNTLFAAYSEQALKLDGFYRSYDNEDGATVLSRNGGIAKASTWGFNVGYDFGVANTGFGYISTKASASPVTVDYALAGVNVPMGSLSVGATFGWSKLAGVSDLPASAFTGLGNPAAPNALKKQIFSAAEGIATGWSLGAKYDLSKRTSITANYAAWTRAGYSQAELFLDNSNTGLVGYGPIETQANLLLSHSF